MMDTFDDLHSFAFLQADEITNDHHHAAVFINNSNNNNNNDSHSEKNHSNDHEECSSGSDSPSAAASNSSDDDMCLTKDEPASPASSSCETPMHHSLNAADSIQNATQRSWRLTHLSGLLLANNSNALKDISYFTDNINVEVRTRSDTSNPQVPERLYSSLKYEMRHSVMRDLLLDSTNLLMCKVEVVNPQDHHEEILKTNGQKLIKGIQEVTAMSKNASGSALECKMKIQFTDVSYHHEKKYFAFKVSFIDPLIHVSEPVLVMVSAPFQVFARRPTTRSKKDGSVSMEPSTPVSTSIPAPVAVSKKTATLKQQQAKATVAPAVKRAKEPAQQQQQQAPAAKKMKPAAIVVPPMEQQAKEVDSKIQLKKGASLNDFLQCLDLLIAFKNSLTHDDQKIALEVAQKRLLMSSTAAAGAKNQLGKSKQLQVTAEQDSINSFFSDL